MQRYKNIANIVMDIVAGLLLIFGVLGLGFTFIMAIIIFKMEFWEAVALITITLFVLWRVIRWARLY
jgi:cytochrome c biogenesis protein CcdA